MKIMKEKNINVFNKDVIKKKSYLYTNDELYSSFTATNKQTSELKNLIRKYFHKKIKIIDIGCGDGKYTIELFKNISPSLILGIDPAKNAVKVATEKVKNKYDGRIRFQTGNIYSIDKIIKNEKFDLAVVRGVLHHLYRPQIAIKKLNNIFLSVIVLEPNGYNPILKIIEKTSSYHREHEEKSYWPPLLNKWFEKEGYKVVEQKFFGVVPYFFPENMARFLKSTEVFLEKISLLKRFYCGTNLILYRRYLIKT